MELQEINRLLAGENEKLQLYALREWESNHRQDPEPLFTALNSSSPNTVGAALVLAAKHHPASCASKILKLLTASDSRIRRLAVEHLVPAMGNPAQEALASLLKKEKDPFVLASAVTTGARLRVSPELLKPFLNHTEVRLRANTIRALGALGSPDIRPLIEPALKDPYLRVQGEALIALAPLVSQTDLEKHILHRLKSSDPMVRAATIIITAQLPLPQRLPMIIERLQDPELRVVVCSLRGLALLNDPLATHHLIQLFFSDERPEVRSLLLTSLTRVPAEVLRGHFDRVGVPTNIDQKIFSYILDLVFAIEIWEPFLPWVIASVERIESHLRKKGLGILLKRLIFFRTNLNSLLARAEKEGVPDERALAARIRWRAGEVSGREHLRTMLFSNKPTDRQAAVNELKKENNLLARGALEEARQAGIAEAFIEKQGPELPTTHSPVVLPDLQAQLTISWGNKSEAPSPIPEEKISKPSSPQQAPDPGKKASFPHRRKKGPR